MDETNSDLWQKPDTIQLIELVYELSTSSGTDKYNNNELYIEVANKLFESGYSRTYLQCKKKWKELFATYTEYKKNPASEPPVYFDELDRVLSDSQEDDASNEPANSFGPVWTEYETNFLINVMKVGNFINKLKTDEPSTVYEQISEYMQKIGPIMRTKDDIQQRWKNLKQSYIKYIKGELIRFKYFDLMDSLLDWEPDTIAFEEDQFKDGHEYGDETYQNPDDFDNDLKNFGSAKRALNWTHKETECLLTVLQKYKIKQVKRESISAVFDEASLQLRIQGFKRSGEQCRVKFKHLKVKYFETARKKQTGEKNPERYFYHFAKMHDIMQGEDTDENSEFGGDEGYEVEYLEDHLDVGSKAYVKEQVDAQSYGGLGRSRKGRVIWTQKETQLLLNLLKAKNIKKYCRRQTFEEIAQELLKAGYKRSAHNCMIKWKNLRNQLYSSIRNMVEGKEEQCPFYDEICEIVQKNGQVDISIMEQEQFDESDHDDSLDLDPPAVKQEKKRPNSHESSPVLSSPKQPEKRIKSTETIPSTDSSSSDETNLVCNYKMDDIQHYCMSLAPTIQKLDAKKQAKIKIEIQQLLYKAEFDQEF